jgi:hypothetical protein
MKNHSSSPWSRLTAAARRAPSAGADFADAGQPDCAAPFGFAARVVACAHIAAAPSYASIFERLAPRALGLACACALAMVAWGSLSSSAEAKASDISSDLYDPVGEVINSTQS